MGINFLKSRLAPCQTKIAKTNMVVELRTGWYVLREEIKRTPALAIRVVRSFPKTPIPSSSSGLPVGGGQKCADKNAPGVYARVSERYSKITDIICNNTPNNHPKASFCSDSPDPDPPVASPTTPTTPTTSTTPTKPTTPTTPTTPGNGDCPKNGKCPDGRTKFEMDILTDDWGGEDNKMSLTKKKSSKNNKKEKVINIPSMEPNTEYNECKCLEVGKYKFEFFDREGDGLYDDAYCKVYLNGKKILKVTTKTGDWRK